MHCSVPFHGTYCVYWWTSAVTVREVSDAVQTDVKVLQISHSSKR